MPPKLRVDGAQGLRLLLVDERGCSLDLVSVAIEARAKDTVLKNREVRLSTSDPKVIHAAADGSIRTHDVGRAKVTAEVEGVSAELEVVVEPSLKYDCPRLEFTHPYEIDFPTTTRKPHSDWGDCQLEKSSSRLKQNVAKIPPGVRADVDSILESCCCMSESVRKQIDQQRLNDERRRRDAREFRKDRTIVYDRHGRPVKSG